MAVVIGHSQTKFLSEYLRKDEFSVFSYPGYKVNMFLNEEVIYDVTPYFSRVVLVVGANDIGRRSPLQIVRDIRNLCETIHQCSPSARLLLSEILPRAQNEFLGCEIEWDYLDQWNRDACYVNRLLDEFAKEVQYVDIIQHPEFHTIFGARRNYMSRDGLHLSYEGTEQIVYNIEEMVYDTAPTQESVYSEQSCVTSEAKKVYSEQSCVTSKAKKVYSEHSCVTSKARKVYSKQSCVTSEAKKVYSEKSCVTSEAKKVYSEQSCVTSEAKKVYSEQSCVTSRTWRIPISRRRMKSARKTTVRSTKPRDHMKISSSSTTTTTVISDLPSAPTLKSVPRVRKRHCISPFYEVTSCQQYKPKRKKTMSKVNKTVVMKGNDTIHLIETTSKFILNTDLEINSDNDVKTCVNESGLVGGGQDIPVFSKTNRKITYHEAADILIQNVDGSKTKVTPYRPSAGSVYVFDDSGNASTKEDWRADGYTWRNFGKRIYDTVDGKTIEKCYFKIYNQGIISNEFQKDVFRFAGDDYNGCTVLVYYGNDEAYKGLPHGNRKKNTRQHKRTKPSVIKEIKQSGTDTNPKKLYDKLKSKESQDCKLNGVGVPRNARQIKNIQSKLKNENMLSHDALYALHLLVEHLDNYILSIKTTPDLEVIIGNKDLFDELNKLLQLEECTITLFYDTTFNLGDFYVSTLAIQHPMFKEKPLIPIAFMVHERKFQTSHEQFIETIKRNIPNLESTKVLIVTDREKGILNAFESRIKNSKLLICWNHILNDIKFWVRKHAGKSDDVRVYDMHVRSLLQSESKTELDEKLQLFKETWSESFLNYFEDNIYDTIINYSAKWILKNEGVYNPYSGITNNVSESLNAQLKRLIEYKEKRIDEIVLFLYYMQGNLLTDLILAFCGESDWTLHPNFKFAARDVDTANLPSNICSPDKIIELIKGNLSELLRKPENNENVKQTNSEPLDHIDNQPENKSKELPSQTSLAAKAIMENNVILVPQMAAFMVKGSKEDKHSVTLFPKEKCSCPAVSRCYHIIAAMMAIGMPLPENKKQYNLTQLRKNCRPKHQKKCGTKKGRIGDNNDTTIVPAPDSIKKRYKPDTPQSVTNSEINISYVCSTPKPDSNNIKTPKSILKSTNKQDLTKTKDRKRKLIFNEPKEIKIPKLDLSEICEDNQLIELDSSRDDNCNVQDLQIENKWWLKDINLTESDKHALINGEKLNSNHMEAVNKLLRKQVGNLMNGLQLTEKVPIFSELDNRWKCKVPMDPILKSPGCQIHHTHRDHWVVTFFHEDNIYLIDSLGNDRPLDKLIPDGLKIQLSQIYGRDKKVLTLNVPSINKQTNSVDCGLFAIAYATSFSLRQSLCYDLIFDHKLLREHLKNCFEFNKMTEFPLTKKTLSIRRRKNNKMVDIEQYCICNMPACLDDMVQCDKCLCWFHKFCVNAPSDISSIECDFYCGIC